MTFLEPKTDLRPFAREVAISDGLDEQKRIRASCQPYPSFSARKLPTPAFSLMNVGK